MGGRGASFGGGGESTFKYEGNPFTKGNTPSMNKMIKAVMDAPVGSRISSYTSGFGSDSRLNYEITVRGMSKKMITQINNEGKRVGNSVVLSRGNIKSKLGGGFSGEVKISPPKRTRGR